MAASRAALVRRKAKLEEQIRQAGEREKEAQQLKKDSDQARFILGGLLLSQDALPDVLRSLLVDHAARRRPSDQGGWRFIAKRWAIDLPDLAPVPVSPMAVSSDAVLEVSDAG